MAENTDIKKEDDQMKSMSLGDHLEELRTRLFLAIAGLIVGFIVALIFGKFLFGIVVEPYADAVKLTGGTPHMQAIKPAEKFLMYLKTSLIFGLIFTAPWVFYQIWKFIAPGLYKNETKFVYIVTPASAALFVGGATFFLTVIAPLALKFFIGFDVGVEYVETNLTLDHYVDFMLALTLAFGIAFQLPIVIFFAEKLGLVTIEKLRKGRKFVFLGLFVAAAGATPPDPVSMLSLAAPLYVLYEGTIIVCAMLRRDSKKNEAESAEKDE
ncbi:twin-arginine translocase subunit TatC [Sedimentisphaera salicampi]|uniref:twin-arginine translocase subunit TatC n=1 Tax=Sedimentisphaera salicampi TaxID=1941349 RepID=UPI000B9A3818|nr:twin-arginine translocase subunit TatC [Sedimentisphaera salicampi]OXU15322.1 Sec-independent protein translocase protein TatC [Sedimentisphaera salicampi]